MIPKEKGQQGGKIIASGGYGCVFYPALACSGSNNGIKTKKKGRGMVSKLMRAKYAKEEYEKIQFIRRKLVSIPRMEDYFVLNASLCYLRRISRPDLSNFNAKCHLLQKDGITAANVNSKLHQLIALNLPNMGRAVDEYIVQHNTYQTLATLHQRLTHFYFHGLLAMNRRHIYHSDVKDSNLLVDDGLKHVRLIDWGLAVEYTPGGGKHKLSILPTSWRYRSFQFNVPFSIILLSDFFQEQYEKARISAATSEADVRAFLIDFVALWIQNEGEGHYKYINEMLQHLFPVSKQEKKEDLALLTILDYLLAIVRKFAASAPGEKWHRQEYADRVYVHNVDTWGFFCVYYPMVEAISKKHSGPPTSGEKALFGAIQRLFLLYENAAQPIPVPAIKSAFTGIQRALTELARTRESLDSSGITLRGKSTVYPYTYYRQQSNRRKRKKERNSFH